MSEYTVRCHKIANLFLQNLAKLVDLHKDYFVNMFDENALTYARLNYYPNCPKPDDVFGMKPHTDASVITIVFIDDNVSGLQLQKDGVWYSVPIVPNALLVNVGDVMEVRMCEKLQNCDS
uniref:Fe2OG dioxygenase domain-containing protein n=1 Tax=Aegilops tauschii subsp. strangulata TaxID=200361 RepID=A0A453QWX6_AEGTS